MTAVERRLPATAKDDDALEAEIAEAEAQQFAGGLRRIAVAPVPQRQPPADLDRAGAAAWGRHRSRLRPAKPTASPRCLQFERARSRSRCARIRLAQAVEKGVGTPPGCGGMGRTP